MRVETPTCLDHVLELKHTRSFNRLPLLLLFILCAQLSGCISIPITGKKGTTYHLIVGFGIVSVNESPNRAVIVTDARALGMSVSDRPGLRVGLGYSSSTVVTVAEGAEDVRVEASRRPGGPLVIQVPRAKLNFSPQWR